MDTSSQPVRDAYLASHGRRVLCAWCRRGQIADVVRSTRSATPVEIRLTPGMIWDVERECYRISKRARRGDQSSSRVYRVSNPTEPARVSATRRTRPWGDAHLYQSDVATVTCLATDAWGEPSYQAYGPGIPARVVCPFDRCGRVNLLTPALAIDTTRQHR